MESANSNDKAVESGAPGSAKCRAIFISYRRSDTEGEAGRLYDDLVRAYSDDSVFMDVTGIQPGLDFRKAIDSNVAGCGVLLAVIGPNWATTTDSSGNLRLANPDDYVRLEIASALSKQIPVIPVLVHGAHMPPLEQLPDDLKDLRYRNSVELTHARWNSDVALLIGALKNYVSVNPATQTETVHATVAVQLPPPQPAAASASSKSRSPLALGAVAAIAIGAAVAIFSALHHSASPTQPTTATLQTATATPQLAVATPATAASDPTASPAANVSTASPSARVPQAKQQPAVTPASASAPAATTAESSAFLGDWKSDHESIKSNDEILAISIVDFGGQLIVRPRGKCPKGVCNWGPKNATITGLDAVTDSWQLHNTENETKLHRAVTLSMRVNQDGLDVTIHNIFTKPEGEKVDTYIHREFVKGQP